MKKKEFEMKVRKIRSSKTNEEFKIRKLNRTYIEYLRSQYSDDAIKFVKRFVLDKYTQENPPIQLHGVFLESAKHYIKNGMYSEASSILEKISDTRNMSILKEVELQKNIIKVKQSAEKGEINQEALDNLQKITANDEKYELDTAQHGKFTEYDLLTSYFEDIPIETLNSEIFPVNMTKPKIHRSTPNPEAENTRNTQYIEALSAEKRLEFLKEHFDIERIRVGREKFTGTIIFEIKDSDLVIAENFYRMDRNGDCVEDYGKATYIIPKQAELSLIDLSRGELREKIGTEGQIDKVRHNSETYYERLVKKFNRLQSEEYQKISIEEDKKDITLEDDEKITSQDEETATPKVEKRNPKQITREENEEFLNNLNNNLGNIITPNVMEGLLSRASYSFNNLYNKKLKDKIFENLDIMEVPEEQKEIEAQKVFLYLKMTQNLSMINNYMIKGKELDDLVELAILDYNFAMDFYMAHKDDEIPYSELVKGMKEYVRTSQDNLIPEQSEDKEINLEPLVGDKIEGPKKSKTIDIAIKFKELIERSNQIDKQLEKVNEELAQKREEYNKAAAKTQNAKEQEELARQATIKAVSQEEIAKNAMQDSENLAEQLKKEQEELQAKLAKIEELLR